MISSVFTAPTPVEWVPQPDGTERAVDREMHLFAIWHPDVKQCWRWKILRHGLLPLGMDWCDTRPLTLYPGEDGPYLGGAVDETDYRRVI